MASSTTQSLSDNQVVTDSAGNVTVAWNNSASAPGLQASTRSAVTHVWSAPVTISEAGTFADELSLAVDAAGNVTALWARRVTGASPRVQSAFRDAATGAWSAPRFVDDAAVVTSVRDTDLAVAADGTVHAIWITSNQGGSAKVWVTRRPTPTSSWEVPFQIDDTPGTPNIDDTQIAVGPNGRAFAAWTAYVSPGNRVQRAFVRETGEWSTAANLSGSETAIGMALTALPDGQFVAAWTSPGNGSQNPGAAFVKAVVDGPTFSATPMELGRTATATAVGEPLVASDAAGNATLTWMRNDGGRRVLAATWSGSSWQTQAVSPDGAAGMPAAVAYDRSGNAHIGWVRVNSSVVDTPGRMLVSTQPAGGVFGAPVDLSLGEADGRQARLAFDATGNGVELWNYPGTNAYRIKAAGFDAAAPALTGAGSVSVPAAGTAGQAAAMTASPFNAWGDTAVSWDFGDGATAAGGAVSHTYAAPGTYTVKATASDAVGAATESRTITIAAVTGLSGGTGGPGAGGSTPKPTPEALLTGKKITLAAILKRSKKAKKCPKSATASVKANVKGKTYKGSAKLKVASVKVDGKSRCKATGTLKLNSTPPASVKSLSVKVSGGSLTARTLKAVRS